MSVQINVDYQPSTVAGSFKFGRLYLFDESYYYPCVTSFCPHLNKAAGECRDCALVLEEV